MVKTITLEKYNLELNESSVCKVKSFLAYEGISNYWLVGVFMFLFKPRQHRQIRLATFKVIFSRTERKNKRRNCRKISPSLSTTLPASISRISNMHRIMVSRYLPVQIPRFWLSHSTVYYVLIFLQVCLCQGVS